MSDLETVLTGHLMLDEPRPSGWRPVNCAICNDHGAKGKRGGFLFQNGAVSYRCFNCTHKASWHPAFEQLPNDSMQIVFDSFGVTTDVIQRFTFNASNAKPKEDRERQSTPTVELPAGVVKIADASDEIKQLAINFLVERKIDHHVDKFFVGDLVADQVTNWTGYLCHVVKLDGRNVFVEGREILGVINDKRPKYRGLGKKQQVVGNLDTIKRTGSDPLYVVESYFDALLIDGVCTYTMDISEEQVELLNKRTTRPKVVVPDRNVRHNKFLRIGQRNSWEISFPEVSKDCVDVGQAIEKYGLLYVKLSLNEQRVPCAGIGEIMMMSWSGK